MLSVISNRTLLSLDCGICLYFLLSGSHCGFAVCGLLLLVTVGSRWDGTPGVPRVTKGCLLGVCVVLYMVTVGLFSGALLEGNVLRIVRAAVIGG